MTWKFEFIYSIIFLAIPALGFSQGLRETKTFDFDWRFSLEDAIDPHFDDSNWEKVQLPHDWSIKQPISKENAGKGWMEGSMGYLPGGIGWYRKAFTLSKSYKGKKVVNDSLVYVAMYKGDKDCAISYKCDDGFKEHYDLVFPILEKYNMPGTFRIWGKCIDNGKVLFDFDPFGEPIYVELKPKNPVFSPSNKL